MVATLSAESPSMAVRNHRSKALDQKISADTAKLGIHWVFSTMQEVRSSSTLPAATDANPHVEVCPSLGRIVWCVAV